MNAAQSLAAHLEQHEEIEADAPTEFVITTLEQATWAARKIRNLHDRVGDIATAADNERARIDAWQEEAERPLLDSIEHLSSLLRFYHETELREDAARKSIKLPHGVTLKSRAQQDTWQYEDEAAFLEWAQVSFPDLVVVPEPAPRVDKTAVKAAAKTGELIVTPDAVVTSDGEIVPGVTCTPQPRSFEVKVDA